MITHSIIPHYRAVKYQLRTDTGYYQKVPALVPFSKLPSELKVEATQDARIRANGAAEIIHGRIVSGKYSFFTGLVPTGYLNIYRGNHCEFKAGKKVISFVLFEFNDDLTELSTWFVNGYEPVPASRSQFIANLLIHLTNAGERMGVLRTPKTGQ